MSQEARIVRRIGRDAALITAEIDPHLFVGPLDVRFVRAADLVELHFRFDNLRIEPGDPPVLVRASSRRPAFITITTPPQHITEFTFFEEEIDLPFGLPSIKHLLPPLASHPPPVESLIAGPSRLVLRVTKETIPYTIEGLLRAFGGLDLRVPAGALPAPKPPSRFLTELTEELRSGKLLKIAARDRNTATYEAVYRLKSMVGRFAYAFGNDAAIDAVRHVDAARFYPRLVERIGREHARVDLLRPLPKYRPENPFREEDMRTALELPFRLLLSPHDGLRFWNSAAPVVHNGKVELWHTRLGERADHEQPGPDDDRTVRAVWTRDWDLPFGTASRPGPAAPNALNFPKPKDEDPHDWLKPMTAADRMKVAYQTADFTLKQDDGRTRWTPQPVKVRRLMLSTLGGWLDSRVNFDTMPQGLNLQEWLHRASMGRDFEVKVIYAGFLFPFGHRASLMKITERQFEEVNGTRTAVLVQREFVLVKEPQKNYGNAGYTDGGKQLDLMMPFSTVRILTRITPQLKKYDDPFGLQQGDEPIYFPTVSSGRFKFKAVAADITGNVVEFAIPLLFVSKVYNDFGQAGVDNMKAIAAKYDADKGEKAADLRGQRVDFAPRTSPDDTRADVQSITFSGVSTNAMKNRHSDPKFLPVLNNARAIVPAVAHLAGTTTAATVTYPDAYAKNGFDAVKNAGQVFLAVKGVDLDFTKQSDKSGGLAAPSITVSGLSRLTGPIGGKIDTAAAGTFAPKEFFAALAGAKLFGVVPLMDLAQAVGFDQLDKVPKFISESLSIVSALANDLTVLATTISGMSAKADEVKARALALAPKLDPTKLKNGLPPDADFTLLRDKVTEVLAEEVSKRPEFREIRAALVRVEGVLANLTKLKTFIESFASGALVPEVVHARLAWEPKLANWPAPPDKPIFELDPGARFVISVDIRAATDPAITPVADVHCKIENFHLNLLPPPTDFITIPFKHIAFDMRAGRKPEVDVEMGKIAFTGVLSFVNELDKLIPSGGFSDPPYLDVSSTGIKAGYSLSLPPIAVGIFSLENVSLGADVNVPFIGDALEFSFRFCTREKPFHLIVSLFGGGGFFGITITPKGLRVLEAALEFGAAISVNLGVASGSVSIMAGIYFRMEKADNGTDDKAWLTGYFRLRGEVDVLGLISACIELYLSFTYEFSSGKAVGKATIYVEVEVLFFSATVSVSCEKKFAGSAGDPSFRDLMAPHAGRKPWDEYCGAFAEVV